MWKSSDGLRWEKVADNAWGCAPGSASKCGKDDFMLLHKDGALWSIAGDEETTLPFPQDAEVWKISRGANTSNVVE